MSNASSHSKFGALWPRTTLGRVRESSILLRMPLISRVYIIVPLPRGAGVEACVTAPAILGYGWGLTRIAGSIFALAMPTPVQWVLFGLVAIPLPLCVAMFIVRCRVAIKENLRRAADIEIRKPPAP